MTEKNNEPRGTALVTGAARRVGRVIAVALARAGYDVLVHYRSSETEARAVVAEIESLGRRAKAMQADLADWSQTAHLCEEIGRLGWQVDVLVNSASVYYETPLPTVTPAQWQELLAVNLQAPFVLTQLLGIEMKRRGRGRIINIADCNTTRVYRNFTPYLAAKAGLVAMTEATALELAPEVTVNAISPGTVLPPDESDAEYHEAAVRRSPLKRAGTPEDIADMVVYLATKGQFITGANFRVDGGATIR